MRFMSISLIVVCLFLGCGADKIETPSQVEILTLLDSPVFQFARGELAEFLQKTGELAVVDTIDTKVKRWRFVLQTNELLPPYSFQIQYIKGNREYGLLLEGHDPTCVLHAVYTLLERIGYVFEICGPVAPQHLKMERLVNWSLQIRPFVLQRGVRQHLNFPMDISGYSLDEAKSYVHNLARLRFNAITFHSYPNQWIPGPQAGKDDLAGRFFYGYQYDIPETALFQNNIRNRQVFCIPEIEPFYNDEEKRSQMAVEWLNELMSECKRAGMTIRFSFEPRDMGTDTRQTLTTCETIMSIYPQIETLELLTEETGPWGLEVSEQSVRNVLITHFGEAVLKQRPVYDLLKPGQRGLDNLIGQLGHNIAAAQAFK
ncbi:hypothetical protein JW935_06465, partial [candidate division KSB1 bacterium]|nr:hypothetical protein [candidate division KSB1 bacterium]